MKKTMIAAALAAATVFGAASAAQAATSYATTNVNVRSGPGTSYGVVGVLSAGSRVHVNYCNGSWCSIEQGPVHGWASSSYLESAAPSVVIRPPPIIINPPHYHRPWHPHKPWPGKPGKPNKPWPGKPKPPHHKPPMCKIAPGHPCK